MNKTSKTEKNNIDHNVIYRDLIEDFDPSLTDIGSLNTVHDRHQFESKFDYELTCEQDGVKKEYEVDMFFFIPQNLGINSDTYSRQDFYGDITNYLRVSSSEVLEQEIAIDNWCIPALDNYFKVHLTTLKRQELSQVVIQEIKLFGSSFNSKLKNVHYGLFQVLEKKSEKFLADPSRTVTLKNLLVGMQTLLKCYREKYVYKVREQEILIDKEVKRALLLIDEYNSYRLESVFVSIHRLLSPYANFFEELNAIIEDILRQELEYREKWGLITIDNGSVSLREYYHYRMGLLKKYVSQVLFLEIKNVKNDKKYRNIVAAIGAALAAIWASIANIHYWQMSQQGSGSTMNFRLATIIAIGIIAYVFKDRIKEWSKNYFNEQLKHRLPDFERHMFYTQYDNSGKKKCFLGISTEFMRYLKKDGVLTDVLYIREMGHNDEIEPQRKERIIHYGKKIRFASDIYKDLKNVRSIKDIVRFDFSKFLAKLDEPNKSLLYFDRNKGVMSIEAPKVYHINVVFRYAVNERKAKSHKYTSNIEFERTRIVLNKKGIIRTEEVVPRGEMRYQETIHDY